MNPIDIIMPIALLGVVYFMFIKPQQDERARHEELLQKLTKDDRVITTSGIHGRVVEVGDETVLLDIGDKTRITIDKTSVSRKQGTDAAA